MNETTGARCHASDPPVPHRLGIRRSAARRVWHGRLRGRTATVVPAAVLAAVLVLAGCSGLDGDTGGGASAPAVETGAIQRDAALSAPGAPTADGAPRSGATSAVGLLPRAVIQRATLTVHTRRVGEALEQVRVIVSGASGVVAAERTETGRRGTPTRSVLTLRVPADAFDTVRQDLVGLGRLGSQEVTTDDVSSEVVDVDARIVSAERTLRRIRQLLQEADDFTDVLSLESELARREADLASLKAQQAYLQDQTSLSTIALTLLPPAPVPDAPEEDPAGFVGGLGVGWDALVGLVTVLLTALGVLLPLLLVLLPAGVLVGWAVRRLARRQTVGPSAEQPVQ